MLDPSPHSLDIMWKNLLYCLVPHNAHPSTILVLCSVIVWIYIVQVPLCKYTIYRLVSPNSTHLCSCCYQRPHHWTSYCSLRQWLMTLFWPLSTGIIFTVRLIWIFPKRVPKTPLYKRRFSKPSQPACFVRPTLNISRLPLHVSSLFLYSDFTCSNRLFRRHRFA